jgi:hypothetical protein
MMCGGSHTREAGREVLQCWYVNYSRILGFRVPVAVVVFILVLTLRKHMLVVSFV